MNAGAPSRGAERVPALLVMHADLAAALLRAAAAVYGPIEGVETLSNSGHSRETLEDAIVDRVGHWTHGGLVLTDFWGGSCHTCGIRAARGRGEVVVVTGVNLPMLLDYLHNRDGAEAAGLAERLLRKGQDSVRVQRGQPA
uniref:PTS EIIA type-4 domain-containing protein n=1 Tax=Eiseniibacteriota bacterium TaxID=2212470 RepID=A0A832HZ31_UNCEI